MRHKNQRGQGLTEYTMVLGLITAGLIAMGMVYGDGIRRVSVRTATAIEGQTYSGHLNTNPTHARTRPRQPGHFADARIRQDQYNRKDEPMRSRKERNHDWKQME